jgi:hypothetical protein
MKSEYAITINFFQAGSQATVKGRLCVYDQWSGAVYDLPLYDELAGLELEGRISAGGEWVCTTINYRHYDPLTLEQVETIPDVLRKIKREIDEDTALASDCSYGKYLLKLCGVLGVRCIRIHWPDVLELGENRYGLYNVAHDIDKFVSKKAECYECSAWPVESIS